LVEAVSPLRQARVRSIWDVRALDPESLPEVVYRRLIIDDQVIRPANRHCSRQLEGEACRFAPLRPSPIGTIDGDDRFLQSCPEKRQHKRISDAVEMYDLGATGPAYVCSRQKRVADRVEVERID
jgi:hypothetical protein